MSFQNCMTFLLLQNKKEDIFRNFSVFFVDTMEVSGNQNGLVSSKDLILFPTEESNTGLEQHDGEFMRK